MPTNFEPKRLKPELDIVEPENRVQGPYSRVSPQKSKNVGNQSHSCKFVGDISHKREYNRENTRA